MSESQPRILYANTVPVEQWPSSIEHVFESRKTRNSRIEIEGETFPLVTHGVDDRLMTARTYRKITYASTHPNSGTPITPIHVRVGECFYWTQTSETWRAGDGHPMTGPEGNTGRRADSRFYCPLRETQLGTMVAKTHFHDNRQYWVFYDPELDRSRGGYDEWRNEGPRDLVLHFYFNDDLRFYDDNFGRIEHEIVVREF